MQSENLFLSSGVEDYSNIASCLIHVPDGTVTGDTVCTSLGLTDDSSVEPEETFTLSLVADQFQPVIVTNKTTSVTIIDNDSKLCTCTIYAFAQVYGELRACIVTCSYAMYV